MRIRNKLILLKSCIVDFCRKNKWTAQPVNEKEVHAYDYFTLARSWADDFFVSVEASRNRWRSIALWVLVPMVVLLLLCLSFLIPAQHTVPLMINHYDNGIVTVTPFKQEEAPSNMAQVESDIARYVEFRESYSADTYDYTYRLIHLLSSKNVADDYDQLQTINNKKAPINILGHQGYQSVRIENILFLDSEKSNNPHRKRGRDILHHNLAQVDFVVTTYNKANGHHTTLPLTALISWSYRGIPNNPSDRWMDWNGFIVTSYTVKQRNNH